MILTGGVRTPSAALVGPVADRTIASMHVDQFFLGVHGMDLRAGYTTPNLAEATTNRILVESAREVVVLADSSKWGVVGLADIGPLEIASVVITDDDLTADARSALSENVEPRDHGGGGPVTVKFTTHLADGREIIYFDRTPGVDRAAVDQRTDLPPAQTTSQIRWDPLFRDYTTVAGHRQQRTYKPPADLCPLCASRDGKHTEIPADDYEVVVFENRFPSYSLNSAEVVPLIDEPPFRSAPGAGRAEVVAFTSNHDLPFSQLPPEHVRTVIEAWADRTTALSAFGSIDYVFCFENRGEEIGVTLSHPHGQIYGYPFVPPRFYKAGRGARAPPGAGRQLPAVRPAGRRVRRRLTDRDDVRALGGLRAVRGALALRGAAGAPAAPARPACARRR